MPAESPDEILAGQPRGGIDDDTAPVAGFCADLRATFGAEPLPRHGAPIWQRRTSVVDTLARTTAKVSIGVLAAFVGFGGVAAAGALPAPVQHEVANVADHVGLGFVPDVHAATVVITSTTSASTTTTAARRAPHAKVPPAAHPPGAVHAPGTHATPHERNSPDARDGRGRDEHESDDERDHHEREDHDGDTPKQHDDDRDGEQHDDHQGERKDNRDSGKRHGHGHASTSEHHSPGGSGDSNGTERHGSHEGSD